METKRSAINFCSVLLAGGPHGLVATEYSFATITYEAYVMSFQPFKQSVFTTFNIWEDPLYGQVCVPLRKWKLAVKLTRFYFSNMLY